MELSTLICRSSRHKDLTNLYDDDGSLSSHVTSGHARSARPRARSHSLLTIFTITSYMAIRAVM